jgi:hypothetical protein
MNAETFIAGAGVGLLALVLVLGMPVLLVPLSVALVIWLARVIVAGIHAGR